MSGPMVVSELIAVLGAKVDQAQFADVFALLDKVQAAALKVADLVDQGIERGFKTIDKVALAADAAAEVAEQFGLAADAVQELGYAATLSDSGPEAMTHSLKFLAKAAAEAGSGSKEALESFKGIKISDAKGMLSIEDILENVADKFQSMPQGVEKFNLATKLLGRSGNELIPMLNRGADGIAALREEARLTGNVMGTEALQAGQQYDDQLKRLNFTFSALEKRFATPLIARVTDLFDKLRAMLTTKGAIRAVDALSVGFDRLITTMGLVIDLFAWLTQNESVVTGTIFVIASAVAGLTAWMISLGSASIAAAAGAVAAWIGAAAPFLLVGAAIVLIIDELYTFAEGGETVLGDLIGWFSEIDPESTPFVKMLKTAGALLFDLTDPAKWKALGQAITDWLLSPVTALVDSLHWVLDKLGVADKFDPRVKTNLDEIAPMSGGFPGMADPLNTGGQSFGASFAEKFPGAAPLMDKVAGWGSAAGRGLSFVDKQLQPSWGPNGGEAVQSRIFNAPITVTVPQGTMDPNAVGEAVKKAVREELGNELSNAQAAVGS